MDRPPSSRATLQKQYLIAYNATSSLLWLVLLGRVLLLLPLGYQNVYAGVGQYAKWTQTLAVLEILHSAFKLIRSPLLTTTIQVSSRLLLVWGIVNTYPTASGQSPFYSSMLIAWAVTEVIRYSYFALNVRSERVPAPLAWLRYNTFFVLYPLGIGSEMGCVYLASAAARSTGTKLLLWDVLFLYLPVGYVLYTHMMAQRRKVIRGKQPERRRGD
ncbi:hypothetical protein MMC17_004365 [Xylographa soralifera]|nr:hypothetical protein [Xylographa soralifera]